MVQNFNRRKEGQPLPEVNPLYRIWLLKKNESGVVITRTHYSFINRNNPQACYNYTLNIHKRIRNMEYGWLIDNLQNTLLEVFDSVNWRKPTWQELEVFQSRQWNLEDKKIEDYTQRRRIVIQQLKLKQAC